MKLVLDRWQGLGDNLQVSTIPRRYYEKYGEKCVWISNEIRYRNPEIKQLVWEDNPYIAGFTDEPGENLTHKLRHGKYGWIENWERIYSLEPPYSKKPEIYSIKNAGDIFSVKDRVIIDISYSKETLGPLLEKYPGFIDNHKKCIEGLYKQAVEKGIEFYMVKNPNLSQDASVNLLEGECSDIINSSPIIVSNIREYCNVLANCKQFICTHSGNNSLAATIRKSCLCIIPIEYYNIKYFVFDNVRYITIS